jgi:hypothetical protein
MILNMRAVWHLVGLAQPDHAAARGQPSVGIGGAGAVVALMGLGMLASAAVLGLATVVSTWLAALIIGITLVVVAGVISAFGITQVSSSAPPVPE